MVFRRFKPLLLRFFETFYEATFGKRIMNLKAARLNGERIPLNLAFIRNLSKVQWFLALIDTAIGLATPGDPHQKVSDRYAGTTVISTGFSPFASLASKKSTLKFCSNCRRKLPEKAFYCPYCGKPLIENVG
ncbi:MAG: RDD family protein [Candidatus Bathyarchaeia archaeon]